MLTAGCSRRSVLGIKKREENKEKASRGSQVQVDVMETIWYLVTLALQLPD